MNLVLLVEGAQTEPKVYDSWLKQRFPGLQRVPNVADLTRDSSGFVLVSGKGYPSCYNRVAALAQDIAEQPAWVDAFWLCLDSDEDTFADRHQEASAVMAEEIAKTTLAARHPPLDARVIVQHCCIETWFLGHQRFLRTGPQDRELVAFKRFYDVSQDDPELMAKLPGYLTRQSFHLAYLEAMMRERRVSYSKVNPGVMREAGYFDALRQRVASTGHLPSFGHLLAAMRALGAAV